jgi:DNA-binding NtrC family response regulator
VLAVTSPDDLRCLERILGHTRWTLETASSVAEVATRLRGHPGVVVITDAVLADGDWKDLLACAAQQPSPPPLIVAAHHADDRLWMEVLNSGGYNVVGKPFEGQEVFRVISMAWLHGRKRPKAAAHAGNSR